MSEITTKTWIELEKPAFRNFNEFIAQRLEDGIFRSIAEKMKTALIESGSVKLELPWGFYSAEAKDVGEGANITPVFEPKKAFLNMINDDSVENKEKAHQDEFDQEFLQLFIEYTAYGEFYVNDSVNYNGGKDKGIRMKAEECDYFLNNFGLVIAKIAADKARDGKIYRLEINNAFPHGSFDFEYGEDGTVLSMKFVPHKVFKQYLKDDETAKRAQHADFTPFTSTKVSTIPNLEVRVNADTGKRCFRDWEKVKIFSKIKK